MASVFLCSSESHKPAINKIKQHKLQFSFFHPWLDIGKPCPSISPCVSPTPLVHLSSVTSLSCGRGVDSNWLDVNHMIINLRWVVFFSHGDQFCGTGISWQWHTPDTWPSSPTMKSRPDCTSTSTSPEGGLLCVDKYLKMCVINR